MTGLLVQSSGSSQDIGSREFPATQWDMLQSLCADTPTIQARALDRLVVMYWRPIYYFIRRKGYDDEAAKDLVQAFFADCLARGTLAKVDPARGRFRTFLLTCVERYCHNRYRAARAKKRWPAGGIKHFEDVFHGDRVAFEPRDEETPEEIFHRAWVQDLLLRVLGALERECQATGKQAHFTIFQRRIVDPVLQGAAPPPMCDLAQRLGISEKAACNYLLTARRAYQRLLRDEIRQYALSEKDVASEVQDLFQFLGHVK